MYKLIALFCFSVFSRAQVSGSAYELAKSEREFSAASDSNGVKESFLRYLSDDCLMFNPQPTNGKELYRTRKESGINLTWYPTYVEVSHSGDFGISSGPWEIRKTKGDTPAVVGHYFSIWKKQPDGYWKVIVDNGIRYPKEDRRKEEEYFGTIHARGTMTGEIAKSALLKTDREFAQQVKTAGIKKAYTKYSAVNVRLYRNGYFPAIQKASALSLLATLPQQRVYAPQQAQISSSGDLGFTYGISLNANNDSSSYLRVWRNEGGWKIAVDMLEEFPKE